MERRGFLAGILAAGMAPAIVRAESLMRIVVRDRFTFSQEFLDALANVDWQTLMNGGYSPSNEIWNSRELIIPSYYVDLVDGVPRYVITASAPAKAPSE